MGRSLEDHHEEGERACMSRTEREERGRVCRGSRGRREGVYVAVEGCRGRRGGREGVYVAGGVLRKEREEGGRV